MIQITHRYTGRPLYTSETASSLREAVVQAVVEGANLAGADLADAYLAGAHLAGANLAGADLADAYLADAYLAGAHLAGADLAGACLAGANLAGADLAGAHLADADLAGADLAGARRVPQGVTATEPTDYAAIAERYRARHPEVPVVPGLDRQILQLIESGDGTLDMRDWHRCETTHCRAGWAIVLAGDAGRRLERERGPFHAGAMIYRASTGRVPNFFTTNERALEDLRQCAAEQAHGGGQ